MRCFLLLICLHCIVISVFSQGVYVPLGSSSMHIIDRLEIKRGEQATPMQFNTTTKVYQRNKIAQYVDSFPVKGTRLTKQDFFNLRYLQNDNFEFNSSQSTLSKHKFWGMYERNAAIYSVVDSDFTFIINPVTYLQAGYDTRQQKITTINNRGIVLRGTIGKKLGYFTSLNDEIIKPNSWVQDFYNNYEVIPGAGLLKTEDTDTIQTNLNYSYASGYIVYQPSKYFDIQFGHGKNFLGNGFRTFYMSDFSRENLFLRVNTRVWKINYTNIWGNIYDYVPLGQRNKPKRHYFATIYANINLGKKFNWGLFQTIAFARDSSFGFTGYDPEYLNPIIFYKPIENGLNSPDKTILGTDFKWNLLKRIQLYGQFVISELRVKEMISSDGWFGNKWSTQLGVKYIDAFAVDNLDIQLEANIARPYHYTSFDARNAYVNYNQNMAHPIGANFYEYIGIFRYQPTNRLQLKSTNFYLITGNDTNGSNWGRDIRIGYNTGLPNTYGNYIGQGIKTQIMSSDLLISYMLFHNFFLDFNVTYRKAASNMSIFENETWFVGTAIRWNFTERRWDF